jgi:predicted nuclease with RNAse H fold
MLILVERGIKLASKLRELGYKCIEVFPRATEKILGLKKERRVNKDKYDALLCALTGKYYLNGKYEAVGDEEGQIVIPLIDD